jgi:hypothetical protein
LLIFGEEEDDDEDEVGEDDAEHIAPGGNMTAIRFPALGREGMSPHMLKGNRFSQGQDKDRLRSIRMV